MIGLRRPGWPMVAALAAAGLAIVALAAAQRGHGLPVFAAICGVAMLAGAAYLIWHGDPAWTLSIGLVLACFSGYWDEMGVPTVLAPDRLVLTGGLLAIMLRAPGSRERPPLFFRPVHWLLLVVTLYALCSAVAAGTLLDVTHAAALVERFGVIPFLIFLCAPVAFRTERQRNVLLATLVGLGAYLGLTALFETVGPHALVFPRYILDPNVGILPTRARGPFADPVGLGVALFVCAGAATMGFSQWRSRPARLAALSIALLCVVGLLFTLTRQVWLASVVATIVAALVLPALRRWLVPMLLVAALAVAGALGAVPGLAATVQQRKSDQRSLWDRGNVDRAGLAALETHPLFGVGWETWLDKGPQYLTQADNYPLTRASSRIDIHNAFLAYLAQLGLVGGLLWTAGLFLGAGLSAAIRPPPGLEAWRSLALGLFVFVVIVINFQPGQGFSNVLVWLLPAVVAAPRFWREGARHELARQVLEPRRASEPVPAAPR